MPLRRQVLLVAMQAGDALTVALALVLPALWLAGARDVASARERLGAVEPRAVVLGGLFLLAAHLVFASFGLYRSRRLSTGGEVVRDVALATSVISALLAALLAAEAFALPWHVPAVRLVGSFWLLATVTCAAGRLGLRALLGRVRREGRNLRRVLVVGTNERSLGFAREMESRGELGYRVVGFAGEGEEGLDELHASGFERVSDLEGVPAFLRGNVVDEVVVALPIASHYQDVARIIAACEEQGVIVRLVSNILFDLKLGRSKVEQFHDETVLTISTGAMEGWPTLVKLAFDVVAAVALLVLLAPLFLAVAVAIKMDSRGPVLFVQPRVGRGKRTFRLYKFRTMVADAEARRDEVDHLNEASGPVFKVREDPRLTSVGRILRRTSIDELPQLLNVVKGEMSLVGPRPLPVRDVEGFDRDWQRRRFSVRPGMTGLWQVSGRSSVSFERWMELDMQYIDRWSLWLDLRILARTVTTVLRGTGAA